MIALGLFIAQFRAGVRFGEGMRFPNRKNFISPTIFDRAIWEESTL